MDGVNRASNAGKTFLSGYDVNAKIVVVLSVFVVLIAVVVFFVFTSITISQVQEPVNHFVNSSKRGFVDCLIFNESSSECYDVVLGAVQTYPGNVNNVDKSQDAAGNSFWLISVELKTPVSVQGQSTNNIILKAYSKDNIEIYKAVAK